MRKRDITRIQYKLQDLKEYEAMKAAAAKQKEARNNKMSMNADGSDAHKATTTPLPRTKSEMINQRIGITAPERME